MTARQSLRLVSTALCAIVLFGALSVQPARAGDEEEAVVAIERCLATNKDEPARCFDAAARFCSKQQSLSCPQFETETWRRVARDAEDRIAKSVGSAADLGFIDAATNDLQALQEQACAEVGAAAAEPEQAVAVCLRDRTASRAIALWTLAPPVAAGAR